MKKVSLSGSLRENVGKKDAAALRRQGKVPAVIYGGAEQVHFFVEENAANKLVFTPEVSIVEVEVAGKAIEECLNFARFYFRPPLNFMPIGVPIRHIQEPYFVST